MVDMMSKIPPIAVGEEIIVSCVGVGSKGDGICKVRGYTIFVADALQGHDYRVLVTDVLPTYAFGDVVKEEE